MHNGFISGFAKMKRDLMLAIDPSLFPLIMGTTDTEVLFHLALTFGLDDDPPQALARSFDNKTIEKVLEAFELQLYDGCDACNKPGAGL